MRLFKRLLSIFHQRTLDREMDEEMRAHLEQRTQTNIEAGMKPEEARFAALRQFGWADSIKEECRDQRGLRWLEEFGQDVRYGARQLRKSPGFTAVAVLTIAVGIGANTAVFSFVNAILLKPLPYKDPKRLVMIFENNPSRNWHKMTVGAPLLDEWRRQTTVFEGISFAGWGEFVLTGAGAAEKLQGRTISANSFSLVGIHPVLGRDFGPDEEVHGNNRVALLSNEAWRGKFGSDPNIVGRKLTLNGDPYTVIGVMPPRTHFPDQHLDLWLPLAFSSDQLANRHRHDYRCFAKLKPGATLEQARAEMNTVSMRMESDPQNKGWGSEVVPLQEIMVGDSRPVLLLLLGAVGLVLLIGCANLANLLLARAAARSHEFSIRLALGAGRGRIIRQLLAESLGLSVLGGGAGVGLAFAALKCFGVFAPSNLLRGADRVALDGTTLGFTLVVTVFAAVLFGLAPAQQIANPSLVGRIRDSSRGNSAGPLRRRLTSTLVVSQVAFSLVLLAGAGLFIRSFSRLVTQDLGFNSEHLITISLGLPHKSYPRQQDKEHFFMRLLEQVRAIPGGNSAALGSGVPFTGRMSNLAVRANDQPDTKPGDAVSANYSQVSPGYFQTMNIPLLAGRDFTDRDRSNTPPVLIVDRAFVKNFHLGTNVIGRLVTVGDGAGDSEIIGLVDDIKRSDMAAAPIGEMYRPLTQVCWEGTTLVLRTREDPSVWTRAVRAALDKMDKDIPMEDIRTLIQLVSTSVSQRRLSVQLLTGFAIVALSLATIGIYGVLAENVSQRAREIGVRIALGARRGDVLALIIGQGMSLVMLGVAIGLLAAAGLSRFIVGFLFAVQPLDPATFISVSTLLSLSALLACYLPARRAARVDPIVALRAE